jgi:TonB family protein
VKNKRRKRMKAKSTLAVIVILFSQLLMAQMSSGPMTDNDGVENETSVVPDQDFIKKYELEGKTPTTMRLTGDFVMRTESNCGSEATEVTIPSDSIVNVYRYFPESQCWATKYHGQWGFLPGSKLFPVSRHTMNMNKYDEAPKLRSKIKQKYPREAEEKGITGTVSLRVYIDENGEVTKTTVTKGIPELNQAAIDAIKDAKFKPATFRNKNVGVWIPVSFDFD